MDVDAKFVTLEVIKLGAHYTGTINDDKSLIKQFKKLVNEIDFIGFKYSKDIWGVDKENETTKLINVITNDSLTKQSRNLKEIWKHLLGDAIAYLKHEDRREGDCHDTFAFGVDNLAKFFDKFGSFEDSLSPILSRTRDHIAHVMRVYMLGAIALNQIGIDNVSCDEPLHDGIIREEMKISKGEKEAIWCIISLSHDLGLVMENVFNVNREARNMFEELGRISIRELEYGLSPVFHRMCYDALRLISSDLVCFTAKNSPEESEEESEEPKEELEVLEDENHINECEETSPLFTYKTHTQYKYYTKFLNALDSYDHGVLSCIMLIKNLVYFLESDFLLDDLKPFNDEDARQFLIRRGILRAIASHNCDSIYHLSTLTFPFLLTLFDEMQEWDRPRPHMLQEDEPLEAAIEVQTLSETEIEFCITYTKGDSQTSHVEIYRHAKRKFTKFTKILRSAVAGSKRKFTFIFEIRDNTDGKKWFYKFIHKSPSPSQIEIEFPVSDESWFEWIRTEFPKDFPKNQITSDANSRDGIDWFRWLIKSF